MAAAAVGVEAERRFNLGRAAMGAKIWPKMAVAATKNHRNRQFKQWDQRAKDKIKFEQKIQTARL